MFPSTFWLLMLAIAHQLPRGLQVPQLVAQLRGRLPQVAHPQPHPRHPRQGRDPWLLNQACWTCSRSIQAVEQPVEKKEWNFVFDWMKRLLRPEETRALTTGTCTPLAPSYTA